MTKDLRSLMKNEEFARLEYYGLVRPSKEKRKFLQMLNSSEGIERLWVIIELAKMGEFAPFVEAKPFLTHQDAHTRLHAVQLIAHAGNPEQVLWIKDTLDIVLNEGTPFELSNVLILLGESLYRGALDILIGCIGQDVIYGESEEDLKAALWGFYPHEELWNSDIGAQGKDSEQIRTLYTRFSKTMPAEKCMFEGEILFLGNMTKTVIAKMLDSGGQPLRLYDEPLVLSMFSGVACPLQHDTICTREKAVQMLEYAKMISGLRLQAGQKYFYGHLVT